MYASFLEVAKQLTTTLLFWFRLNNIVSNNVSRAPEQSIGL